MNSEVWDRHSSDVVETLRRAMVDANMSIDELSALSGVSREEILSVLAGGTDVDPKTSALLAATLSGRIAEQAYRIPVKDMAERPTKPCAKSSA